jgi:RNA polymerase sigma-70 factor (ECF subfamily)
MVSQDGIPSDEELMTRAAGGDVAAFEQLGRSALAEDVVQEAFLKIFVRASDYRPTARFRTYLYNVIWHLCVDAFRRKRPLALDTLPPSEGRVDPPDEALLRRERGDMVRRAVDELPPRQRMALVLKHFEDMSYDDIAEVMECSAGAVDSLLSRARTSLRESLRDLL